MLKFDVDVHDSKLHTTFFSFYVKLFLAEDFIQAMICENIFMSSPAGNQGPITGRNEILLHKFKECQIGCRKKIVKPYRT